jgi:hypothetical protein
MIFLEFPNYLNEIMPVIQYWLKMAEDTTGLPLLLQGQSDTHAVGVSQQLMNNASTNLRLIVKAWDDCVCKKNIEDLYEWVQLYGPDSAKGDAKAVPLGSSTLLVKELQMQALMQLGDRTLQPAYGLSPKKWAQMFLEGFQIDYDHLQLDPDEEQKLEAAQAQPDPKVQVAQINAQVQQMIAQMEDATSRVKLALDAQAKALSIQQAENAVQTQAGANITQEAMKQQGGMQGKMLDAHADLAKEGVKAGLQPKEEGGEATPEPKPPANVGEALSTLGLQ